MKTFWYIKNVLYYNISFLIIFIIMQQFCIYYATDQNKINKATMIILYLNSELLQ